MGVCLSFRNVHDTLYKGQDRERVKVNITIIILRASWGLLHLEGEEELVAGSTYSKGTMPRGQKSCGTGSRSSHQRRKW